MCIRDSLILGYYAFNHFRSRCSLMRRKLQRYRFEIVNSGFFGDAESYLITETVYIAHGNASLPVRAAHGKTEL